MSSNDHDLWLAVEHKSIPKIEELLRETGQAVYTEENFIVDLVTELRKLSIINLHLAVRHGIWRVVLIPMKGGRLLGLGEDLLRAFIDMAEDLKKYRQRLETLTT